MTELSEIVKKFIRSRHPNYKDNSEMFRRKLIKYKASVIFYKETFEKYDVDPYIILNRLYPIHNPKKKSLIINFDA